MCVSIEECFAYAVAIVRFGFLGEFVQKGDSFRTRTFDCPRFSQYVSERILFVQIRDKVGTRSTGNVDNSTTRSLEKFSKRIVDATDTKVIGVYCFFGGISPTNL